MVMSSSAMTSDAEKLVAITIGDIVSWGEGPERESGTVEGWHYDRKQHNLLVGQRGGKRQVVIALSAIVARNREMGVDRGTISFD
jgi:hypothetical protein